jgi:hypothetical protein
MASTSAPPLVIDNRPQNHSFSTDPYSLQSVSTVNVTSSQPRSPAVASIIAAAAASREAELYRIPAPDRGRGHLPPLNTPSLFRSGRRAAF